MYRTGPYLIAKAISEIPLLGVSSLFRHLPRLFAHYLADFFFPTNQFLNTIFGSIIYPLVGLQKGRFRKFIGLTSLHSIASEGNCHDALPS